ncbi:MAG: hypothetical protein M1814_004302 [Vezdaea aestivalis]|nr:MAG: hypothetical protein M1814_004302 [Vezdaea aestivalis]
MLGPLQIKESECDLLIIGAGPAGLMAAAWASRYGVSTRIIDKKSTRTVTGHADGLQCRTLEILDSFGFAHSIVSQSCREVEICSWNPDESGQLRRTQRLLSQRVGTSRYQQAVINQGIIEQHFLDFFEKDGNINVDRSVVSDSLSFDEECGDDKDARPITVTLRHLEEDEAGEIWYSLPFRKLYIKFLTNLSPTSSSNYGAMSKDDHKTAQKMPCTDQTTQEKSVTKFERIKAKYMIGCDGAHSWTRKQLGIQLEGEQSDFLWGVMDIVPLTNFPDIRHPCAVHSVNGSVMMVPRENRLVRLYIQITKADAPGGRLDRTQATLDNIFRAAQKVLLPYTLEYKHCDWWSVYQIGQRVAPKFSQGNRLFLAGDAIHTHSPKVGQGMNVSMQDTYNLGWKICSVITGRASPRILRTYELERRQVALDLIAADYETSQFYSSSKKRSNKDHQALRDKYYLFLSGVAVNYSHSDLTVQPTPTVALSRAKIDGPSTNDAVGPKDQIIVDLSTPNFEKSEEGPVVSPSSNDKLSSKGWNPAYSINSNSLNNSDAFLATESPGDEAPDTTDLMSNSSIGSTAPSLNGDSNQNNSPMESSTTSTGSSVSGCLDFPVHTMESSASSIRSINSEQCLQNCARRREPFVSEQLVASSQHTSPRNLDAEASPPINPAQQPLLIGDQIAESDSNEQTARLKENADTTESKHLDYILTSALESCGAVDGACTTKDSLKSLQSEWEMAGNVSDSLMPTGLNITPVSNPSLAPNIKLGVRLTPHQVLNQADASPTHLSTLLLSTGKWRLFVFGGNISKETQLRRVQSLGADLVKPSSPLRKYTPNSAPIDSLIEVVMVHSAPREEVELLDLHEVYHPWDDDLGWDYWKVFADSKALDGTYGDVYSQFGIDRDQGCMVLCRPDQHVAYIGGLDSAANLTTYFDTVVM